MEENWAPDGSDELFLEKFCGDDPPARRDYWRALLGEIARAPKAECHCHLAGSMRPETLKQLAMNTSGLDWGFCTEGFGYSIARRIMEGDIDDIKRHLEYRKSRGSLSDYMLAYSLPKTVIATADAVRRVAFELCEDCAREGVSYLEIRFNPWMLTGRIKVPDYLKALAGGMMEAMERYGGLKAVLVLSLVKDYEPDLLDRILDETLEAAADSLVAGLVQGVDSAGNEIGFDPRRYGLVYAKAREAGLPVVFHAGEAYASLEDGIGMIEDAIGIFDAKRIGHGLAAGIEPKSLYQTRDLNGSVYGSERIDRIAARQAALRELLKEKQIPVEVCLSSNLHTGNVKSLDKHPVTTFLKEEVPFVICTDNRWVSHTKLSWELMRLARLAGYDFASLQPIIDRGFDYGVVRLSSD